MSKGSLFWANASGKLGESVFYRAGGEQRNRTYVKNIKNPKTLAQAEQRLSMLNFSAGFRALKPILAQSFTNRPANQSGFNAFVKANKSVMFPVITREGANEGLAVLGDAVVAQGNLTEYGTPYRYTDQSDFLGVAVDFKFPADPDGSKVTEFAELASDSQSGILNFSSADTYAKFLSIFDLPSDLVMNVIIGEYEDEGYRYSVTTISKDAITGSSLSKIGLLSLNFDGPDSMPFLPGSTISLGYRAALEETDETYVAIILSRKIDGKIETCPSRLISLSSSVDLTAQFRKGGEIYNQLMAQYQPSSGNILSV